ncbi:WD repeat-containing protein 48 isoform X1, partial [Tanacetum coccineum]
MGCDELIDDAIGDSAMHRVGSAGNTSNSGRPRKEKRLTYLLNDADVTKHCAGVNCLAVLKQSEPDNNSYLFTGSRDGTLKRWALGEEGATYSTTFESHVDWVNDAVLVGGNTLISCSSDTTVKVWDCLSDGTCTKTLRQHTDYVTCLAAAEKNCAVERVQDWQSNIVASGGLGGEVFIWDLEAALAPLNKTSDAAVGESSKGMNASGNSVPVTSLRTISSSNSITAHTDQPQGYVPIAAKGHKESVYALAMNESGTLMVSGGTEKYTEEVFLSFHTPPEDSYLIDIFHLLYGLFFMSSSSDFSLFILGDIAVRVWDSRTGSKTMKLRGHTDNIRALLLDSTGRLNLVNSYPAQSVNTQSSEWFCLSGSSDSMI